MTTIAYVKSGSVDARVRQLWGQAAADWRQPRWAVMALFLTPLFLAFVGVAFGVISKDLYKWLVEEDRFAENLQVVFFVSASVLSVMYARRLFTVGEHLPAAFYIIAAVALFFIAGEEISWGQRIVGWETSEAMMERNKQGETNIHNLHGALALFNFGMLAVCAAGTILPLLLLRSGRLVARFPLLARVTPHFSLVLYFALPFAWRFYRFVAPMPERYSFAISEYAEVMELVFALGVVLMLVYQLRSLATEAKSADTA